MTPEGRVVEAIRKAVKAVGGSARKVKWVGRRGAPDWFVMVGDHAWFIEAKAPGKRPTLIQQHEHAVLRAHGMCVWVADDAGRVAAAIRCVAAGTAPEDLWRGHAI